jgi:hypothetical protein
VARWESVGQKGPRPDHPPGWCVSAVLARGYWEGIPHLEGVIDHPVLRPDGTILEQRGYDESTGLLLAKQVKVPRIPEHPTRDDAVAACNLLFDEVVCDFPFKNPAHQAAWLASMLTPLARYAFEGKSPLFLVDANQAGTGKGLLLHSTSRIVTGTDFAVTHYTNDENELRKRITAHAMAGSEMVLFDNITGNFGCGALDLALTGTIWEDRVLGINKMYRGPLNATFYGTANNCSVVGDTARRVLPIRLETPLQEPEKRTGFRHKHQLVYVQENRGKQLAACLTILRAYCAAGRPDQDLEAWGSFEAWSDLVRGAIVWAGLPDPVGTRMHLKESGDGAAQEIAGLHKIWELVLEKGDSGLTAAQVITILYPTQERNVGGPRYTEFRTARGILEDMLGAKPDAYRLGLKLRTIRRRVYEGRFLDHVSGNRAVARWTLYNADQLHSPSGEEQEEE